MPATPHHFPQGSVNEPGHASRSPSPCTTPGSGRRDRRAHATTAPGARRALTSGQGGAFASVLRRTWASTTDRADGGIGRPATARHFTRAVVRRQAPRRARDSPRAPLGEALPSPSGARPPVRRGRRRRGPCRRSPSSRNPRTRRAQDYERPDRFFARVDSCPQVAFLLYPVGFARRFRRPTLRDRYGRPPLKLVTSGGR